MVIAMLLVACQGGSGSDTDAPLALSDALEPATVGEPYTGVLDVSGGVPPYTFVMTDGVLPEGMAFNPAGAISGVRYDAEPVAFSVTVTDDAGSTAAADLELLAQWPGGMLPCGETISGELTGSAALDYGYGVDWEDTDGYTFLQLPLPTDGTKRIVVDVETDALFTYTLLGAPGVLPGSTDLSSYSVYYTGYGDELVIDLATGWDLETYHAVGEPITLLLTTEEATAWQATSTCTDGPVFQTLQFYPTELGEFLYVNYNVEGDNADHTFSIDGELPSWTELNDSYGQIYGTAEEAGLWEYEITVQGPDGTQRTEQSSFGVFAIDALPCDTQTVVTLEDGYYSGSVTGYYDPRGFASLQTDIPDDVSAITITAEGLVEGSLGITSPGSRYRFYGGSHGSTTRDAETLSALISPASYPTLAAHRQQDGALYSVLASYYEAGDPLTLSVSCDTRPRLDKAGLPVLEEGQPESLTLSATGGQAPYRFEATDLPDGASLSVDGVLSHEGLSAGSWLVDLTITDSAEQSLAETWTLYAGEDACDGAERLRCGDSVSFSLTSAYYQDPETGMRSLCVLSDHDDVEQLVLTMSAASDTWTGLSLVHPGHTPAEALTAGYQTLEWADENETVGAVMRSGSEHDLDLYRELVLPVVVLSYGPSDVTVALDCE